MSNRASQSAVLLVSFLLGAIPASAAPAAPPRIVAHTSLNRSHQNAQCPNQGGILDSISVPVGQPITLYVYVFVAPQVDEAFQVSSLNPAIAAAGDPTQAFSPVVTIPAGANESNAFLLYGTAVGQTTLQIVSLSGDYGTSETPTTAWNLDQGFLDANPPTSSTCRAGSQLSTDPNVLAICGSPVTGAATDGVTQVLMRTAAGLAGTACYEIVTNDGYDDGNIANQVTTTQSVNSLDYAFSFYQSPTSFGSTDSSRSINVQFSFTPSLGNGNTSSFQQSITVVRPPILLLHGLWSGPDAWSNFPHTEDAFHTYNPDSYHATAGSNFSVNAPQVPGFVQNTLAQFRAKGYAGVQADVIAHSMGGILSRMYIGSSQFSQPANYDLGDVRRLITLDTPHYGSSFANLLVGLHQSRPVPTQLLVSPLGSILQGAVCDLSENSTAIESSLGGLSTQIPARTVSSDGGPVGQYLAPIQFALTANVCLVRILTTCLKSIYLFPQDKVSGFTPTQPNDAIVASSSQHGGLADGPDYPSLLHFGVNLLGFSLVAGVTTSAQVAQDAYSLLDGPASNFDSAIPAAISNGSGTPITVNGVPATNASDYAVQCSIGGPMNPGGARTLDALARSSGQPADAAPDAAPDPRVTITSPAAGQHFTAGSNITVDVQVLASLNAGSVLLTISGIGQVETTSLGNGQFSATTQIPDGFAGPLTITPMAVAEINNQPAFLVGASVTVSVRKPSAPTRLALARQYFYIPPTTASEQLSLTGYYADGSQADLTSAASGTAYLSSNPKVAAVNASGLVTILSQGIAVVTAANSSLKTFAVFVVQNPASPLPPADVTGQFAIQLSGFVLNRNTGFFVQQASIANSTGIPVPGPLYLLFESLPSGVSLINQAGASKTVSPGSPYVVLPLGPDGLTLAPGQAAQFTLQFLDAARTRITYTPKVIQSSLRP